MPDYGHALFETAIGACGLAWGPAGLIGVLLPEASAEATRTRLTRRYPQAPESDPPAPAHRFVQAMAGFAGDAGASLATSSPRPSGAALLLVSPNGAA